MHKHSRQYGFRPLFASLLLATASFTVSAVPAADAEETQQLDRKACLSGLRSKAEDHGFPAPLLANTFADISLLQRVIQLDRSQPEFVYTIWDYLETRVNEDRVERGRRMQREHAKLLRKVHRDYHVRPEYLLAFWGLETNFGRYFGDIPVLDSLATLACDARRGEFFTRQFLEALQIIRRGDMQPQQMRGSWAGAMGHTQFMPSTFNSYAVDYDGDGKRDLYRSLSDAFASSANYLQAIGWKDGQRWGREVRLPDDFNWSLSGLGVRYPLQFWREQGVKTVHGAPVPVVEGMDASLLLPAGRHGPAFLVYHNFRVILDWNRSISYALAVGMLADRIAGMGELHRKPRDLPRLRTEEVREIQSLLNAMGFNAGPVDGIVGHRTRDAIEAFQIRHGLPADGYPDRALLRSLRAAGQS